MNQSETQIMSKKPTMKNSFFTSMNEYENKDKERVEAPQPLIKKKEENKIL